MFSIKNAANLLLHKNYDHAINLVDGKQPLYSLIYSLLENKLSIFYKYINKNLAYKFITMSKFLADAPILFMPKLN